MKSKGADLILEISVWCSSWPWNQQTIANWIAEMLISIASGCAYLIITGAFLTFFIAICQYHKAFQEYFQALIVQCDTVNQSDPATLHQLLCKAVRFHTTTKE